MSRSNIKPPVRPRRNVPASEDLAAGREDKDGLREFLRDQDAQAVPAAPATPRAKSARSGSGDELVRLTVRVPASVRQRFKVAMSLRGESHTAVFTELLEQWLADKEPTPAEVHHLLQGERPR